MVQELWRTEHLPDTYFLLCPTCPASFREAAPTLTKALRIAVNERVNHVACGGQVWVYYPRSLDDEPQIWDSTGKVIGWKGQPPEPLVVSINGILTRLQFPLDETIRVDVFFDGHWEEVEKIPFNPSDEGN